MGEKSQTFTPKILSCFSARWQRQKSIFNPICPLLHVYQLIGYGGILLTSVSKDTEHPK